MSVRTIHLAKPPRTYRVDPARFALLRGGNPKASLARAKAILAASPQELGTVFGVSRQAVNLWLADGVPLQRRADVERLLDVAQRLARTFKAERIPQIARQKIPALRGASILGTLQKPDGASRVMIALDRLGSYVSLP